MVANNNRNTSSKSYRFTVFQEIEHGQSTVRPVDPPRRDDIERAGRRKAARRSIEGAFRAKRRARHVRIVHAFPCTHSERTQSACLCSETPVVTRSI